MGLADAGAAVTLPSANGQSTAAQQRRRAVAQPKAPNSVIAMLAAPDTT